MRLLSIRKSGMSIKAGFAMAAGALTLLASPAPVPAQDAPAAINAYYDRPEYLTQTDTQLVHWRRLLLTARGMDKLR